MGRFISKICSHVYVEGALEAVKLYKEAFELLYKEGNPCTGVSFPNYMQNDSAGADVYLAKDQGIQL